MSNSVIKFNKLDVNRIIFTSLEDNPRVKSQKIGYIRYKESDDADEQQLKIQTPEIKSEVYGIPREGPYYPDAKSRSFYKFGFCHERKQYVNEGIDYDAIEQFYNKLIKIDEFCNTDEFRKQIFGEKAYNQYAYQPLVRIPDEDPDEVLVDKNGNPLYRPPYAKIGLSLEYNTDQDNQSTKPTFRILERKDGIRTQVELNNFEDVLTYVKYLSKLRFILSFSKIYAMKTKSGTEKKKYGITLKATHIEVQRQVGSQKAAFIEDAFVDSDTDETINNTVKVSRKMGNLDIEDEKDEEDEYNVPNERVHKQSNPMKEEDEEDEDAESETLEEEEVVEEVKPKSKTAPKSKTTAKTKIATK